MESPGLVSSLNNANDLTPEFMGLMESAYEIATNYLKNAVSLYVFIKYKNSNAWKAGPWSAWIIYIENMKYGMDQDKANLPEAAYFNQSEKKKETDKLTNYCL